MRAASRPNHNSPRSERGATLPSEFGRQLHTPYRAPPQNRIHSKNRLVRAVVGEVQLF